MAAPGPHFILGLAHPNGVSRSTQTLDHMEARAEPRHRTHGTPLSEWIALIPGELSIDAVGLWQAVNGLKRGYELSVAQLDGGVQDCVAALLAAGGKPVQGSNIDKRWHLRADLAHPEDQALAKVMKYWHALGRDPDFGDIWFARPEFYEGEP